MSTRPRDELIRQIEEARDRHLRPVRGAFGTGLEWRACHAAIRSLYDMWWGIDGGHPERALQLLTEALRDLRAGRADEVLIERVKVAAQLPANGDMT